MSIQPGANLYTQGFGSRPENVEVPTVQSRAPTSADTNYPIGKRWIYLNNGEYSLVEITITNNIPSATWVLSGTNTGPLNTLTGNSGGALSPSAGNINIVGSGVITVTGSGSTLTISETPGTGLLSTLTGGSGGAISPTAGNITVAGTANEITTTGSGSTITWSTPTTFIAPGSIASTTTMTSGGAFTVTTGGATITAGGLTVTAGGAAVTGTTTINNSGAATTTIGTGGTGAVNIGNATGNTAVTGSLTASTTLTATLGAITATNGNLDLATAGNKLLIATGANASVGTSAAMTAGTITISTSAVTANSIIFLSSNTPGGTAGILSAPAASRIAGTSFVINSSSSLDTSTVNWWIVN